MVQFDKDSILAHAGTIGVVDGTVARHDNVRVKFESESHTMWIPMDALLRCEGRPVDLDIESPRFKYAKALANFGFQLAFQHMLDGGFVERA